MPFRVILLKENNELGSRKCETRTEAVAYAKVWQSLRSVTVSAIIVDDDNNEVLFTERTAEGIKPSGRPRKS
jgi:hypothetical protein